MEERGDRSEGRGEGRGRVKRGEEGGVKKKVGRPTKVEGLMRERANCLPLPELFKRKEKRKDKQEEKKEIEEMKALRKISKMGGSSEGQERGGWMEVIREMTAGFREKKKEIRKMKESKEEMRKWMECLREGWERYNEGLKKRKEELENRIEKYEWGRKGRKEEEEKKEGERRGKVEERSKRLELDEVKKRREERKRNIIIKGMVIKEDGLEGLRKDVEGVVKVTGTNVKTEEVRRLGNKDKGGVGIVG